MVRRSAAIVWVLVAVGLAQAENGYRNLVNRPYATVADGPLGGQVLDAAPAGRAAVAPTRALGERWAPLWFRQAQAHGRLAANQPAPALPNVRFQRSGGRLVTPDLDAFRGRARGASTLGDPTNRLAYLWTPASGDTVGKGWSSTQQARLQAYLDSSLAAILRIYGPPAFADTVRIVHDPTLSSTEMAVYDASAKEIRLELLYDTHGGDPLTTQIDDYDLHVLTHALLLAYRGEAAIGFDCWEAGMARAAQLLVVSQTLPNFGFVARDFNLLYGLYDLLNQPGLESPSFLGADAGTNGESLRTELGLFRAYLAQAAWLKVYAENPSLFVNFNQSYYQALATDSGLHYNVPSLRNLLAAQASTVEGLPLADWFTRQHCFDTSVVPGVKLFLYNIPRKDAIAGSVLNTLSINPYAFQVSSTNVQSPLAGTVDFTYAAYDDFDLTGAVQGASGIGGVQASLGTAGNAAGLGSVVATFNAIAGELLGIQQQRIVVTATYNGLKRQLYFANDSLADDGLSPFDLFGTVTNGLVGTLKIEIEGRDPVTADVKQGAFRCRVNGGLPTSARAHLTWTPASTDGTSQTDSLQRNLMFLGALGSGKDTANGFAALTVETPPATYSTLSATLPAGLRLITLPAFSGRATAATVLGVDPAKLILARTDGAVTSYEPWRNGDLYRLWPSTPSFQPGYGYWVKSSTPLTINYQGVVATKDTPYRLSLAPGWQQFGNPWPDLNLKLSDLQVQAADASASVTLAQAQTSGLVSGGVFRYTPESGFALLAPDAVLTPFEGFFLDVLSPKGVVLVFPNHVSARRQQAVPAAGWQITLRAQCGALSDSSCGVGLAPGLATGFNSRCIPKPPPFGEFVSLSLPHPDWGRLAGRYAYDVRATASSADWDLTVETSAPNSSVTLSWPDLRALPADTNLVLTDLDSGRQRSLRSVASYVLTTNAAGQHRLRLSAVRGERARLALLSFDLQPTRGGGQTAAWRLSTPADVTLVLGTPSGRVLTTATSGRAAASSDTLAVPLLDSAGRPLPNGLYRVDLVAVADDGQTLRTSRLVRLVR